MTEVYNTPLMDLVYQAATVHRMYNDPAMVRFQFVRGRATVPARADGGRARARCRAPPPWLARPIPP